MCGSLRLERLDKTIHVGDAIPREAVDGLPTDDNNPTWNSWARVEGKADGSREFKDMWQPDKWHVVLIKAEEFTEKHKDTGKHITFRTNGRFIAGIANDYGEIRILTRKAKQGREASVHHRHPVQVSRNMGKEGFIEFLNRKLGTNF